MEAASGTGAAAAPPGRAAAAAPLSWRAVAPTAATWAVAVLTLAARAAAPALAAASLPEMPAAAAAGLGAAAAEAAVCPLWSLSHPRLRTPGPRACCAGVNSVRLKRLVGTRCNRTCTRKIWRLELLQKFLLRAQLRERQRARLRQGAAALTLALPGFPLQLVLASLPQLSLQLLLPPPLLLLHASRTERARPPLFPEHHLLLPNLQFSRLRLRLPLLLHSYGKRIVSPRFLQKDVLLVMTPSLSLRVITSSPQRPLVLCFSRCRSPCRFRFRSRYR